MLRIEGVLCSSDEECNRRLLGTDLPKDEFACVAGDCEVLSAYSLQVMSRQCPTLLCPSLHPSIIFKNLLQMNLNSDKVKRLYEIY